MSAIFDQCPACLTPTQINQDQRNNVLEVYRECRTCSRWNWRLCVGAGIAGLVALIATGYFFRISQFSQATDAFGILLTIIGGYLVFGNLELLLLVGRTLGGYHPLEHMEILARQVRKARIGLGFVIVGLLVQVW